MTTFTRNAQTGTTTACRRRSVLQALAVAACSLGAPLAATRTTLAATRPLRILHIMSYHADWQWNRDQFDGFRAELADLNVEYQVIEMDMKRNSTATWREEISARALDLIERWQPDLVYSNDDYAQEHVVQHYTAGDIPFVFSGVNAAPERYGFDQRRDVTGVMEREHYAETIALLREIVPDVRRIAVLMDADPTWSGVRANMQDALAGVPGVEVVSWDILATFADYQALVQGYQDQVDALAVLGVFNLKDTNGQDVPFEQVLQWTAEHSRLPDFSFWNSRVELGTLAAVGVSGVEQGRLAGVMAHAILVDGQSPDAIPMQPTLRGQPLISLARARHLDLQIPSSTLLKAQVLPAYAWEA